MIPSSLPTSPRRLAVALGLSLTLLAGLAACSGTAAPESQIPTRTITDIAGEVTIPTDPQRIVSVDYYSPAMLVDLGIKPVGVVEGFDSDDPNTRPDRYRAALAQTPTVGTYYELNIEAVLKQKPDLILAETRFLGDGELDRLKKIAPVVQLDAAGKDAWMARSVMIGDAVNKRAEAEAQQEEFLAQAAVVAAEYRDVLTEHSLALFTANMDETEWATYPSGHFYAPVWDALGARFREFTEGEAPEIPGSVSTWLPLEQMGKLNNADIIVYPYVLDDFIAAQSGNALWTGLPAVENGLVFKTIPAAVTSSFAWGSDNLTDIVPLLDQIRAALNK
ncbi:ABC transporter substrate-binding protein [Mycetocola spongiae]|uniref:ABC transporter substrate-binding protein n=1 Tax=Mycetocola spongiae TaxID=2859226 RepID=UPI001CF36E04|nr:ABC transporter substrate-binding protein [Mycetocola spongiae]UCR88897.1 ABC transporter substrate-binding protein [Mycetocola spongiae]